MRTLNKTARIAILATAVVCVLAGSKGHADPMNSLNESLAKTLGHKTGESYLVLGYYYDIQKNFVLVPPVSENADFGLSGHVRAALSFFKFHGFKRVCHDEAGSLYGTEMPPDATCFGGCSGIPRNKQLFIADNYVCQSVTTTSPEAYTIARKISCYDPRVLSGMRTMKLSIIEASLLERTGNEYRAIMTPDSVIGLMMRENSSRATEDLIQKHATELNCTQLN